MPGPRTRRRIAISGVAAVALAGAVATLLVLSDGPRSLRAATPPPTRTQSTTAPSSTPPPGPPREAVSRARPTHFRFAGRGVSVDAQVCAMPWAFNLDPPGEQHHTVCWVRNRIGSAPGSAAGTSYLLGHSWGQDALEVLNPVSARATEEILADVAAAHRGPATLMSGRTTYPVHGLDGATITLWTRTGRLDYTVRQVFGVAKTDWGYLAQVHDGAVANRVVLTTCAERDGVDYPYNIVVEAYLNASRAA